MAEYALLLIDTCLCASEFGPGAKKGSFASALGLVTCLALGGAAFMSWAVKGVEYGREMGVGFALTQAIFVALVKVFDFFEPDGAKE